MSHFSVIVATKDKPTDEILSRELQPFHEFECTGTDGQYVQDIDRTEEARDKFASRTETRLRDSAGVLHSFFDDKGQWRPEFSQPDPDRYDPNRRKRFVPDGYEVVEVPAAQVEKFSEFVAGWYGFEAVPFGEKPDTSGKHKYGYMLLDKSGEVAKCIDRSNPNKKWDYWRVGGRYAGKFQAKGRSPKTRDDLSWEWDRTDDDDKPTGVDVCRKSDLDIDAMKAQAVAARRLWWEQCLSKTELCESDLVAAIQADRAAHAKWLTLPEPRPRGEDYYKWSEEHGGFESKKLGRLWDKPEIAEGQTVEDWINAAEPLTTFAFLMDGKWAEEGRMGWFACVADENPNWQSDFMKIFDTVPDDYWLTVVDCHI